MASPGTLSSTSIEGRAPSISSFFHSFPTDASA